MRYRNTKTGNVIDVPCPVSGDDWEKVESEKKPRKTGTRKEPENK